MYSKVGAISGAQFKLKQFDQQFISDAIKLWLILKFVMKHFVLK